MGFAIDKLDTWSPDGEFKVDAERSSAYAAATNDPIPAHRDGELAPPVFAVVPVWDTMSLAMASITPQEYLLQVVHGEQDMRWHRPLKPGDVLMSRAAPIGVHVKPSGTTVVVKMESRDERGELVVEQYSTTFFRGISEGDSAGEPPPEHKLSGSVKSSDPVATVTQKMDDDQTFRYAEASGDHMPIHLDEEIAKSVGLPGIIIHGLCTMAFTSWAVITSVADGDPTRLRRLAVRFSRPVLPGQEITARIWKVDERDGVATYGFETINPDGHVVVKDGLAGVAN